MDPNTIKDLGSTGAGGIGAAGLLATVRWEAVPYGECVKVGLALIVLFMSYKAYRSKAEPQ